MSKFLAVAGASLLALALMSAPALAYERYSFWSSSDGNVIEFEGPDGDFEIYTDQAVDNCGYSSYREFYRALRRAPDNRVLIQTHACGRDLEVCVAQDAYSDSSDDVCATFRWNRVYG